MRSKLVELARAGTKTGVGPSGRAREKPSVDCVDSRAWHIRLRMDATLARLRQVLAHVDAHLDDDTSDLSLDGLAAVAGLSKFHFHRIFVARFGVGVHRYVQLLRLKRASL